MGQGVLELEAVSRRFGALTAVDDVSVAVAPGEIHALIGENGAGKSTLLKMAAGLVPPSSGSVRVGERRLAPGSAADAAEAGIGMVHQHFMLIGAFRPLENIVLGAEPTSAGGVLDLRAAEARVRLLMESSGLEVPLDRSTDELTVGERQRLEILRVLFRGAKIVLLDEPTAVLSPVEADELYATLGRLAREGNAIAVVTHRLDEVVRFADRVTVLRRGKKVHSSKLRGEGAGEAPLGEEGLTRAIMGGEPPPAFSPPQVDDDAESVLEITGLSLVDAGSSRKLLDDIELMVRSGEIVGVAGVEGNGQRELVRAIAGLEPRARGRIAFGGRDRQGAGEGVRARRAALAVVHEDRHAEGLLLEASVADNLVLGDLGDGRPFDEAATVRRRIHRFQIVPPDADRLAGELSGGNQQKIVIARALDRISEVRDRAGTAGPKGAIVLAQPTRGVDVGAAATIHAAIGAAAASGSGVLVVSADLAELRKLSHRILVMHKGRIVAAVPPNTSEAVIGRAMLGMEAA